MSEKMYDVMSDNSRVETEILEHSDFEVNYEWVYNCKELMRRLDEKLFPIQ